MQYPKVPFRGFRGAWYKLFFLKNILCAFAALRSIIFHNALFGLFEFGFSFLD
jgi:hypothetical protein